MLQMAQNLKVILFNVNVMNKKIYTIIILTTLLTQLPVWSLTFLLALKEKYIFWVLHGRSLELLPLRAIWYFKIYCTVIPVYLICNLTVCLVLLLNKQKNTMHLVLYVCLSLFLTITWFSFFYFALFKLNNGVLSAGPLVPKDWTWGL